VILKIVAAAYFCALAALPFAHHDLACHLKSNTHCISCHVGTSADEGGADPALSHIHLADAGRADVDVWSADAWCVRVPSCGRAPPSGIGALL
jgi:hypothetical protein